MPAEPRWLEPTRGIPLRWGSYEGRYLAGLLFIVGGSLALQGANPRILYLLLAGTVFHTLGWAILPAQGWRRLVVAAPNIAVTWLLLTGPQSVWMLAVPFLSWLLVRQRPPRSYLTLVFVLFGGVAIPPFFHEYEQMPWALAISAAVLVASAWLARFLATTAAPRPGVRSPSVLQ
jgi:hypothetical protein